jgi:hypothetical protein
MVPRCSRPNNVVPAVTAFIICGEAKQVGIARFFRNDGIVSK